MYLKTFNLDENFSSWLLTLLNTVLDDFYPSWTLFLKTFNLAEHKTGNILTYVAKLSKWMTINLA